MGGLVAKTFFSRCAAALYLLLSASIATAAGLGKLTVISALGQPFRGEIDLVSVTKEEQGLLNVRLASPEAFRQADVPLTTFVSNLKISIDTRPSGEQFVKVSSVQPLNEPFVDFLIELYWTSGRLVRAYTALLDPPLNTAEASGGPAEVKILPPAQVLDGAPASAAPPASIEPQPAGSNITQQGGVQSQGVDVEPGLAQGAPREARVVVPEPSAQQLGSGSVTPVGAGIEHTVKRGDTLAKVAVANKPVEVSLDQMLVSMFRANPGAFAGKNMNRLKVGTVLRVPERGSIDDVSAAEARREVRAQAASWNAYREKLAAIAGAGPAMPAASSQSAAGKVGSTTEDKRLSAPEAPKEVLKLSKGEGEKAGMPAAGKVPPDRVRTLEEELAAKNKALGEASQRVAALEKTVKDMELLMEIKSKGMSDVQKAAEASKTPPPDANPSKSADKPAPVPQDTPAAGPKGEAAPVPGADPPKANGAPAVGASPPSAATPEETPKPKPKLPPPPPPPPPPSFLDQLLGEPLILAGAAAAILGIGGFVAYRRRKAGEGGGKQANTKGKGGKKNSSVEPNPDLDDENPGGSVDSASGVGESTDGDPLEEVNVLLNYGRYDLAEKTLQEAIAANPVRYELHTKLLEIFAHRRNTAAFEQLARELQKATGGQGDVWDKVVQLGYQIDPENPRFAAGRTADLSSLSAGALGGSSLAAAAGALGGSDLDFNLELGNSAEVAGTDIDLSGMDAGGQGAVTPTDIDLSELGIAAPGAARLDPSATLPGVMAFQDTVKIETQQPEEAAVGASSALNFSISMPELPAGTAAAAGSAAKNAGSGAGVDFGMDSIDLAGGPAAEQSAPDIDLSGIDLDLGGASATSTAEGTRDERWYDVQTKFDLAKAYQEMGDKEGAREVLQEVIAEGDAQQKQAAEQVLASLG
jgi:pilus assembly protein FimV